MEQLLVTKWRESEPEPRRGGWRSLVLALVLLTGFAVATILVVAVVAPSAGAAGGCGGG
jgi:uncharacterized BrkB/YihY/UPF0761 family membrane protein